MFYNEIPNPLPFSLDIAVKIVIRGRPSNCCGSKERLKIQVALIQKRLALDSQDEVKWTFRGQDGCGHL